MTGYYIMRYEMELSHGENRTKLKLSSVFKSSSSTPAAKVRPIYMYFKTTLEETISPPPPLPPPQLIPNKASLEKDSESEIQLPTNLKITHSRMS